MRICSRVEVSENEDQAEFTSTDFRLASQCSSLYQQYTSPDHDMVTRAIASFKDQSQWKADVLKLMADLKNIRHVPQIKQSRQSPLRRVQSCSSLNKREVQQMQKAQEQVQEEATKDDASPVVNQLFSLSQLQFHYDASTRGHLEKDQLHNFKSICASEGSASTVALKIKKKRAQNKVRGGHEHPRMQKALSQFSKIK